VRRPQRPAVAWRSRVKLGIYDPSWATLQPRTRQRRPLSQGAQLGAGDARVDIDVVGVRAAVATTSPGSATSWMCGPSAWDWIGSQSKQQPHTQCGYAAGLGNGPECRQPGRAGIATYWRCSGAWTRPRCARPVPMLAQVGRLVAARDDRRSGISTTLEVQRHPPISRGIGRSRAIVRPNARRHVRRRGPARAR